MRKLVSEEVLSKELFESIRHWAEMEKAHNPNFDYVFGTKSFSIDQIVEHIEKDTEEGKLLREQIFKTATKGFLGYKPR